MNPVTAAKQKFDSYASMATGLPTGEVDLSKLQVLLSRWQVRNFGGADVMEMLAGVMEELGELAHALLKRRQGIRGMDDQEAFLDAAGDAVADVVVYLIQLCTLLRLDFGTLIERVAEKVMERNWKSNPGTGDGQ